VESGISWVLAYKIFFASSLRMIAPSILASSYKMFGLKSQPMANPPSTSAITSGPPPTTISAPVLARKMFSSASRNGVPGATIGNSWNIGSPSLSLIE